MDGAIVVDDDGVETDIRQRAAEVSPGDSFICTLIDVAAASDVQDGLVGRVKLYILDGAAARQERGHRNP